jgi:transcriptional regulator with XRE-family HTH domain
MALNSVFSLAQDPIHSIDDTRMVQSIGKALRGLRKQRGLSLTDLSQFSGVSTSMLSQIENGRSTPSATVLWKIARTLDVPVSFFLDAYESSQPILVSANDEAYWRISANGQCVWRSLIPPRHNRLVEFFEITLKAGGVEEIAPFPEGTRASLALTEGEVKVVLDGHHHTLHRGDALQFSCTMAHSYINPGHGNAVMYLVVRQSERAG